MSTARVVFQCAACRSLVAAPSFVLDAERGRGGLVCDACGACTWLPARSPGEAGRDGETVVDIELRPDAHRALPAATASTALTTVAPATPATTSRFSAEQRRAIDEKIQKLPPPEGLQADLAQSFEKLLGHWDDEGEHKLFLKKASTVGELAFAGQRYRLVLDAAPNDARAKAAQNDLLGLAMATMAQTRDFGATEEKSNRGQVVMAAFVGFLVLGLIFLVWYVPRLLREGDGSEMMEQTAP
jgi:hypothetical protein